MTRLLLSALAVLLSLGALVVPQAAWAQADPADLVRRFVAGDVATKLALVTDDVVFEGRPCTPRCVGKDELRAVLERQAGLGTQTTLVSLQVSGSTVMTLVDATNAGIRSRGVERIRTRETITIRGELIAARRGEDDTSDPQTAQFLGVPVTPVALPGSGDHAIPLPVPAGVAGLGLLLLGLGLALRWVYRPAEQGTP